MRIVVTGGSNTLLYGGWRPHFEKLLPEDAEVVNLAIGGTTSLTGMFRLLSAGNLKPGDIVIWEYALNEYGHYRHGHRLNALMYHVEALIRIVANAGARLLPVIFTTRTQEVTTRFDDYRARLQFVFRTHDVPFIDVSQDFRKKFNVGRLPEAMFQDNFHYLPNGDIVLGVADEVRRRIDDLPVTEFNGERALFVDPRREYDVVTEFPNAVIETFETRIISTPYFPFGQTLECKVMGRLLGAVLLGAPEGQGFALTVGGKEIGNFSTRRSWEERGPKVIVKQISFHGLLAQPVPCFDREVLIKPAPFAAELIADSSYESDRVEPGDDPAGDGLIGLVVDRVPAQAAGSVQVVGLEEAPVAFDAEPAAKPAAKPGAKKVPAKGGAKGAAQKKRGKAPVRRKAPQPVDPAE